MSLVEQPFGSTPSDQPNKTSIEIAAGGSVAEVIAAVAAVVLAILGLAGTMPGYMMSIACIAVGVGLLFEGGAIAGRYSKLIANMQGSDVGTAEIGGGIAAEALAGAAGVVLGILALIGLNGVALVAVANIVFGGGLLIGSGATSKAGAAPSFRGRGETAHVIREAVFVGAGGEVLVGIGAAVLGILALLGLAPMLLNLIALLGLGGALLLGGSALGAKMFSILRHA